MHYAMVRLKYDHHSIGEFLPPDRQIKLRFAETPRKA